MLRISLCLLHSPPETHQRHVTPLTHFAVTHGGCLLRISYVPVFDFLFAGLLGLSLLFSFLIDRRLFDWRQSSRAAISTSGKVYILPDLLA